MEVNGHIDGELHCTSLIISRGAQVNGTVAADRVVVDGNVEGPIRGGDVILKSQAHVVGDIQHQTLTLERGAYFEGRSVHVDDQSASTSESMHQEKFRRKTERLLLQRRVPASK